LSRHTFLERRDTVFVPCAQLYAFYKSGTPKQGAPAANCYSVLITFCGIVGAPSPIPYTATSNVCVDCAQRSVRVGKNANVMILQNEKKKRHKGMYNYARTIRQMRNIFKPHSYILVYTRLLSARTWTSINTNKNDSESLIIYETLCTQKNLYTVFGIINIEFIRLLKNTCSVLLLSNCFKHMSTHSIIRYIKSRKSFKI